MLPRIKQRMKGPGGCLEVLAIAFPMILSTGSHTVQMFVDRMFIMWHSIEENAAAMPAGIISFAVISIFFGTATYVNTFVAQYIGAGRPQRVGYAVWQGVFFSVVAGALLLVMIPLAPILFRWTQHDPLVQIHEVAYFRLMIIHGIFAIISVAFSGFFTGRGKTWTVMIVNCICVAVNLCLDYCWIFGKFGFPEKGIVGAGLATICASLCNVILFAVLFFRREHRQEFSSVSGMRIDWDLLKRLLRYGLPSGMQFFIDVSAFALFVVFVGRIDNVALTATNTAFQINFLAFMPMIGFGIAVSTLVGQALGRNDPALAERTTWSAAMMTFTYMAIIAAGFVLIPNLFLAPFAANADAEGFAQVATLTRNLLVFVGVYCLVDVGNIIFAATLKGAGDTRFVMIVMFIVSWGVLVVPSFLMIRYAIGPRDGLYAAWAFATLYVICLSAVYFIRFMGGKWKSMRVIEAAPTCPPEHCPPMPTIEVDTV